MDAFLHDPLLSTQTKTVNSHYEPSDQQPHPHSRGHLSAFEMSLCMALQIIIAFFKLTSNWDVSLERMTIIN